MGHGGKKQEQASQVDTQPEALEQARKGHKAQKCSSRQGPTLEAVAAREEGRCRATMSTSPAALPNTLLQQGGGGGSGDG